MQEPESNGFKLSIPKVQSIGSLWKSQAVHALSDWSSENPIRSFDDASMVSASQETTTSDEVDIVFNA